MSSQEYTFRLRGEAEQLIAAHERAALAVDKHADQTAALARSQAVAKAEADRFIQQLERQASAVGRTRTELLAMQAAELGVTAQAAPLIARLQQGERAAAGFARTGKMTANELTNMGYQLNDLAVQIVSGGNPLIALVQQGSQLSGTFGGLRPALAAVASLITPMAVGIGVAAGAVGALALSFIQADAEQTKFARGLMLTGNAAGQTRGSMDELARATAQQAGVTIGAARDITQALASTGQVGPRAMAPLAEAVGRISRLTGETAEAVAKDLAGMSSGVARWAAERNRTLNYLTAEQYRYIRSLEAQGRTEDAMAVNAEALNTALEARTVQLGYLARGWAAVERAASRARDAVRDFGRPQTTEEALASLQGMERVMAARAAAARPGFPLSAGERARIALELRQQQAELQELLRLERRGAAAQAEDAARNRRAIEAESQESQSAQLAIVKAGQAERRAAQQLALQGDLIALERSYEQGALSLAGYVEVRRRLEEQGLAIKRQAVEQELALERQREAAAGSPNEVRQSQARQAELRAQLITLQGERLQLAEHVRQQFGLRQAALAAELALVQANYAAQRTVREQALGAERAALERSYANNQVGFAAYVQERRRLEEQALAEREAAVDQEIRLEQRRSAGLGGNEAMQSQARLVQLRSQRAALAGDRQRLADEALGGFGAGTTLRELAESNRAASLAMLADDRQRARAQLAVEEQRLREQLGLAQRHGEDRRRVEEELATWRVLRERELTEALKPEWQRRLDEWANVERRRQQVSDEVAGAFVEGGRKAFGDLVAEGELSLSNLRDLALRTFGEQLFERSGLGASFAAAGNAVADGIGAALQAVLPAQGADAAAQAQAVEALGKAARSSAEQVLAKTAAEKIGAAVTEQGTAADGTQALASDAAAGSLAVMSRAAYAAAAALASVAASSTTETVGNLVGAAVGGTVDNARGGVYSGMPELAAYSNQVVSMPTTFAFARGGARRGRMGEESAEAIFPLTRGPSGHLGVRAQVSQTAPPEVNVEVINNLGVQAEATVERRPDGLLRVVLDAVAADMRAGGQTARAAAERLGLNNAASLTRRRGGG